MKDATLRDIFPKENKPTTKFCIYKEGSWRFAIPPPPAVKTTDNNTVSYYKINTNFGIAHSKQVNPEKTMKRGRSGDYLVEDRTRAYSIMSASEYNLYFPASRASSSPRYSNKTTTRTSGSLKDPKFIERISEERDSPQYNKVRKTPPRGGSTY